MLGKQFPRVQKEANKNHECERPHPPTGDMQGDTAKPKGLFFLPQMSKYVSHGYPVDIPYSEDNIWAGGSVMSAILPDGEQWETAALMHNNALQHRLPVSDYL